MLSLDSFSCFKITANEASVLLNHIIFQIVLRTSAEGLNKKLLHLYSFGLEIENFRLIFEGLMDKQFKFVEDMTHSLSLHRTIQTEALKK